MTKKQGKHRTLTERLTGGYFTFAGAVEIFLGCSELMYHVPYNSCYQGITVIIGGCLTYSFARLVWEKGIDFSKW